MIVMMTKFNDCRLWYELNLQKQPKFYVTHLSFLQGSFGVKGRTTDRTDPKRINKEEVPGTRELIKNLLY